MNGRTFNWPTNRRKLIVSATPSIRSQKKTIICGYFHVGRTFFRHAGLFLKLLFYVFPLDIECPDSTLWIFCLSTCWSFNKSSIVLNCLEITAPELSFCGGFFVHSLTGEVGLLIVSLSGVNDILFMRLLRSTWVDRVDEDSLGLRKLEYPGERPVWVRLMSKQYFLTESDDLPSSCSSEWRGVRLFLVAKFLALLVFG